MSTISKPSKPIPAPHHKLFARPAEQPKQVCTPPAPTATTYDHILAHLTAVNNAHTATTPTDPIPESTPSSLATSTSTSSISDSDETQSTDDTQSASRNSSMAFTVSDRQLHPRHPINYYEMLLKRLHGKLQIKDSQ